MKHHAKAELIDLYASIGKIITSSLNLKSVLKGVMDEIRIFFDPQNWSLLSYNSVKDELQFLIAEGIDFNKVKDLKISAQNGVAGLVVKTGKAVFIPDTSKDNSYNKQIDEITGFKTESIIAVPVRFKDRILGVIEIINRQGGEHFTDEEYVILQSIADFAAIAFSNVELYEETLRLAHIDTLTGAQNRNSLNKFLASCEHEPNRSTRFIIASIDLDRFKEINDTMGHVAGDKVLSLISGKIAEILPQDGKFFRIGGDEFLAAVPESKEFNKDTFQSHLERIQYECSLNSPPFQFSKGLLTGTGSEIKRLLYESDLLMYYDKRH